MITIHKLISPENQTLFERFPELNKIWEVPALQENARESYEQYGLIEYKNEKKGEIFAIMEGEEAVGIIGWFEYGDIPDVVRLRYYGVVPSRRGKKYGEEAMRLFLQHLSTATPEKYRWLSESVTLGRAVAPRVIAHFKSMGFEEFDDPGYGSNAGCGPVQSLKIRIPGR